MSIDIDTEALSGAQAQAVAALLSEPSIKAAALSVNIAPSSLYRWLNTDEAFVRAYRAAKINALEVAVGKLHTASSSAVDALLGALAPDVPAGVRVRAALGILGKSFEGVQLLDLAKVIEAYEAEANEDGE